MDLTLSLPDSLRSWVEEQATLEGYANVTEFVEQILRKEQHERRRKWRDEVEQKLLAALDSGEPVEVTPEFWESRRQELKKRLERRVKAQGP
jgi:antitoxin ParD1/3/4